MGNRDAEQQQPRSRMPRNIEAAEFYRREAERLRDVAADLEFADLSKHLVAMANRYDRMAALADNLYAHGPGQLPP